MLLQAMQLAIPGYAAYYSRPCSFNRVKLENCEEMHKNIPTSQVFVSGGGKMEEMENCPQKVDNGEN